MKRLFTLTLIISTFLCGFSQFNQTHDDGVGYCTHHEHAKSLKNEYTQFRSSNDLLDKYDVKFYFLDINIENNTTYISGNATINMEVTAPYLDTLMLELYDQMVVDSVFINGTKQTYSRSGDELYVLSDVVFGMNDMVSVKVYYHGTPPSGSFFVGVTTQHSSTWNKNVTWTLSEPYAAKDWWPTKQELTDKADSSWVFLTTSDNNLAGSQGLLTAVTPMPNNKLRFEWKSNYPVAYYLISFAVAEYQEYNIYAHPEGLGDSILIQNYIYDSPGCLANYKDGIDQTVEFVELFSDLYIMYPFADEKYGHCQTQLGGGMEHQTMSTMGGFGFGLVAHELGHMWFGDNVTCATWSDIWINEGFATYTDYLANEKVSGYYAAQSWLTGRHNNVKNSPGGSVYVPEEELGNIFRIFDGRLSYSKGALIIHMIRHELNDDDVFFQVMHDFQEMYADTSATGLDFMAVLNDVSGMDFTQFFDQWYFGEGYPIFDILWSQDADHLYLTSTQSSSTNITTLFQMTVPVSVKYDDGTFETFRPYQETNLDQFSFAIDQPVVDVVIDPDQWILHHLSSLIVGIEDLENPVHFTIGPNPVKDKLRIYFSKEEQQSVQISISDMSGRQVLRSEVSGSISTLSLSSLNDGLYMVKVTDGENEMVRKMVKSH